MSRKHFIALAGTLIATRPWNKAVQDHQAKMEQWRFMVRSIADLCGESNQRFDRAQFFAAAGYER